MGRIGARFLIEAQARARVRLIGKIRPDVPHPPHMLKTLLVVVWWLVV
jgi:hypothetical protein